MLPTLENHLTFWRTMADDLKRGRTVLATLEHAKEKLAGTLFVRVAEGLVLDISGGASLSDAMARSETVFSRCVRTMVRAGEAGGVVDVIAGRIAEGLQDGSFPLPGATEARKDAPALYWRAFGQLLWSGVPIFEALDLVALEVAGPRLQEATQTIRQAILDGRSLAAALETMPDLFPEEVRLAVDHGEQQGDLDGAAFRIADALDAGTLDSLVPDAAALKADRDEEGDRSVVIDFVAEMIRAAFEQRASDIHLDPTEDGRGRLRLRVDGVLHDVEPPPEGLFPRIVSRVKIMANLDLAERRLPQDGRILISLRGRALDLRVCAVPTVLGERIVMRLLDAQAVCLDLERIGFLEDQLPTVRSLCHLPNGVVICNGPTGSGKTTLLYAMLNEIDRDKCCVLSVEDPVEYRLPGVGQVQVDHRRGLTFARALRSILRQDPDVIMVGELRDLETVQVSVQCSLTGHLVLTTLHANTSPGAVKRLLDIGLEPFLVNATLAGVITQRLVRVLCPECKQAASPPLHSIPPEAVDYVQRAGSAAFYGPKGCEACRGMGYRGRTAIHEILVADDRVRQAVAAEGDLASIRNAALAAGMKPMLMAGLEKAARGITSLQEVCRVVPHGPND